MDRTERALLRIESNPDPSERTARVVERNKGKLRRRLDSLSPGDPERAYLLFVLSDALMAEQSVVAEEGRPGGQAALQAEQKRIQDEVIEVLREATKVAAPNDPDRHYYHGNLGAMLAQRWGQGDVSFDLMLEGRRHVRTAVELVPEDHPLHCNWANQLAANIALGDGEPNAQSLAEALELHHRVLRLVHPDDPFRSRYQMSAAGVMVQLAAVNRDAELAVRARDQALAAFKNTHEFDPMAANLYMSFRMIHQAHMAVRAG